MLNKDGIRELAYVVKIDAIEPIVGSDNCEAAVIGGWRVMVRKEVFAAGDYAVYFEIDSKVPEIKCFEFLAPKHYKIKTQKYTFGGKGNFVSQGLVMHFQDFKDENEEMFKWAKDLWRRGIDGEDITNTPLTQEIGVVYSVVEDNKRKANSDKYKKMAQRHAKLFKNSKFIQWLYRRNWGKKILFFFLGSKKDARASFWPDWVRKTDEERVQNLPQLFPPDDQTWIVTEKIDGSSTTFTMKRVKKTFKDTFEFYVCSRNVCFDKPEKEERCFYDTNIYTQMAKKYDIEFLMQDMLENHPNWEFLTIQGETYGAGVQKRDYGMQDIDFAAFNYIYGTKEGEVKRLNPAEMAFELGKYAIPCVPILDTEFKLPQTIDEMVAYADGNSQIDGEYREGVVLRSADGVNSFKAVSNEYLLKKGE